MGKATRECNIKQIKYIQEKLHSMIIYNRLNGRTRRKVNWFTILYYSYGAMIVIILHGVRLNIIIYEDSK